MTAKQKAEDIFNSNYIIIAEYGKEPSEEIVISLLSIKFGVKQCEDMIEFLEHSEDYYCKKNYWEEVKQYLLEM